MHVLVCEASHRVVKLRQLHGFTMFYAYVPITCRERVAVLHAEWTGRGGWPEVVGM
jgi:hypothetical protein